MVEGESETDTVGSGNTRDVPIIGTATKGAAAGPSGMTCEHLRLLLPCVRGLHLLFPDLRENGPEVKCRRQSSTSLKGQVDGIV